VVCLDYEWTERWSFRTLAQRILVPEVLRPEALRRAGFPLERVRHYPGLKEELYLPEFVPEPGFREALGIGAQQLLVVLRPPSLTANYRNERSVELFRAVLEYVLARRDVVAILLCRTQHDRLLVEPYRMQAPERIRIPERVLPGLQLLYWADAVISGGGTMNREAALLGTPVYSVFGGRRGAVDEWLAQQGRLRWLSRVEELRLEPRQPSAHFRYPDKGLAAAIVGHLEQCLRSGG
jgi:predicted glycosyltransferase